MRIVLALSIILGVIQSAEACPASADPCLKYRRMRQPIELAVTTYRHDLAGFPRRFDRKTIAQFITTGSWVPFITTTQFDAQTVRFVAASDTRRVRPSKLRLVRVRQIERRDDTTYVDLDGELYAFGICDAEERRVTACLQRVGVLPADQ